MKDIISIFEPGEGNRMTGSDWILLTVLSSGYKKPVRRSAIVSYGTFGGGTTFVDIAGRSIEVRESEEEVARLVGSPYVNGVETTTVVEDANIER